MRREGKVGDTADRDPHHGKQDRIRNRQPLGQRQQQADQPEQGGNDKNGLDGIGHDGRPRRAYRQPHLSTRRTSLRVFRRLTDAGIPLTVIPGRTRLGRARINLFKSP